MKNIVFYIILISFSIEARATIPPFSVQIRAAIRMSQAITAFVETNPDPSGLLPDDDHKTIAPQPTGTGDGEIVINHVIFPIHWDGTTVTLRTE